MRHLADAEILGPLGHVLALGVVEHNAHGRTLIHRGVAAWMVLHITDNAPVPRIVRTTIKARVVAIPDNLPKLLHEHGHARSAALLDERANPRDIARPRPLAALAAGDHPVQPVQSR